MCKKSKFVARMRLLFEPSVLLPNGKRSSALEDENIRPFSRKIMIHLDPAQSDHPNTKEIGYGA